jgi:hypothetical protein
MLCPFGSDSFLKIGLHVSSNGPYMCAGLYGSIHLIQDVLRWGFVYQMVYMYVQASVDLTLMSTSFKKFEDMACLIRCMCRPRQMSHPIHLIQEVSRGGFLYHQTVSAGLNRSHLLSISFNKFADQAACHIKLSVSVHASIDPTIYPHDTRSFHNSVLKGLWNTGDMGV